MGNYACGRPDNCYRSTEPAAEIRKSGSMSVAGNGAKAENEAPASAKAPVAATPSTYSHRARYRLYPIWV